MVFHHEKQEILQPIANSVWC